MIKKILLSTIGISLMLSASACSEKEADKVGDAQRCLDEYSNKGAGDLNSCLTKIDGIETAAAYNIRCAVGYLKEDFTTQSFIQAFEEIETISGPNVINFLDRMTFDKAGTTGAAVAENFNTASAVYNYCAKSKGKGATILATFTFLVNALYDYECKGAPPLLGSCQMNDTTVLATGLGAALLDNGASGAELKSSLGTIVISTNQISCESGEANKTLCEFLDRSITNAGGPENTTQVGHEFLQVLTSP